jgi:hypothetical protein
MGHRKYGSIVTDAKGNTIELYGRVTAPNGYRLIHSDERPQEDDLVYFESNVFGLKTGNNPGSWCKVIDVGNGYSNENGYIYARKKSLATYHK